MAVSALRLHGCAAVQDVLPSASAGCFSQKFPEGNTQGVYIRPFISLRKAVLFRRGIAACPQQLCVSVGLRFFLSGSVKVNEADMAVLSDQQVGRLNVPVQDAVTVQEGQYRAKLQEPAGQLLFACFYLCDGTASNVFFDNDRLACFPTDIINLWQIRMCQFPQTVIETGVTGQMFFNRHPAMGSVIDQINLAFGAVL
nr:hypothetical protein [uncultured Oscillibacter sp.]